MNAALTISELNVSLGGQNVLRKVSAAAQPGQVTAIIGPNGAGKSTLLRAVRGLLPYEGNIKYGDRALQSLSRNERARFAAYVPQRSALEADLRVQDVVGHGRYAHQNLATGRLSKADEHAVQKALYSVDAEHLSSRTYLSLSGGEQRRILIARALATEAPLILLDEPTAFLDVAHVLQIHALLRSLAKQGKAIVAALHPLDDVRTHTDHAVLLSEGRVVASGESRKIVSATQVREVYGVSLREGGALGFELEVEPS